MTGKVTHAGNAGETCSHEGTGEIEIDKNRKLHTAQ